MRKIQPAFYIFILLIIFSMIWLIYYQPKSVTVLPEHILNIFSKQNKNDLVETKEIVQQNFSLTPIPKTDPFNYSDVSSADYSKLVDLNNFQFLYLVECTKEGRYPNLLITVHTAPSNVEKRQAIRETWGMERTETKLIFMMGIPQNQEEINIVAGEHEKYKDIVQGNFMDTYKNLTYKHTMIFKYVVYHCPKIKYLLKTDDDIFINMPILLSHIGGYNNENIAKPSELLYCFPMIYSPAIREKSKWQITFEEFPDEYYPPYCAGYVEICTLDTIFRLYQAAQISKFLWVDDAFATGVVRQAAKIKITPIPNVLQLNSKEMITIININNTYPNMIYPFIVGPINIQPKAIRALWDITTHRKEK